MKQCMTYKSITVSQSREVLRIQFLNQVNKNSLQKSGPFKS